MESNPATNSDVISRLTLSTSGSNHWRRVSAPGEPLADRRPPQALGQSALIQLVKLMPDWPWLTIANPLTIHLRNGP